MTVSFIIVNHIMNEDSENVEEEESGDVSFCVLVSGIEVATNGTIVI